MSSARSGLQNPWGLSGTFDGVVHALRGWSGILAAKATAAMWVVVGVGELVTSPSFPPVRCHARTLKRREADSSSVLTTAVDTTNSFTGDRGEIGAQAPSKVFRPERD